MPHSDPSTLSRAALIAATLAVATLLASPASAADRRPDSEPLLVYDGEVWIRARLRAAADALAGSRTLRLTLRAQVCDSSRCLAPETHFFSLNLELDPAGGSSTRHAALFK